MVVHFDNLDKQVFREMGYRETVKGIPDPGVSGPDTITLTKTQIAVLFKIRDAGTRGFGQIRDYKSGTLRGGVYIPSGQVAYNLEDKGVVRVGDRKQVSRRTGRGTNGYEKKTEGGYVKMGGSGRDVVDGVANQLGYKRANTDAAQDFVDEILRNHPSA